MADDYFDAKLALDPTTGNVVGSAMADVYAITDTSFTTPLAITDLQDIPVAHLVASPTGIYPPFKVAGGAQEVLAKAGTMITPLTSRDGLKGEPGDKGDPGTGVDTSGSNAGEVLTSKGPGQDPVWSSAVSGISGAPTVWPSTFNPATHSQPISTISDVTSVGRLVATATTQQAARAAIGAGTGNGTSNLALGDTATTAMPGSRVFNASEVVFTPNPGGPLAGASTVGAALELAAQTGSGGGGGTAEIRTLRWSSGAYPAFPTSKPAGAVKYLAMGPVQPTITNVAGGIPSWIGSGASQVLFEYEYWNLA